MTKNGLKEGDWVRVKKGGAVGRIVCAETHVVCVERNRLVAEIEARKDLVRIDRRTAFLAELKGLLERYDAFFSVDAEGRCCEDDVEKVEFAVFVGDEKMTRDVTEDCIVEADNIMGFEKD